MAHEPRTISFLEHDGRLKHYGIARHDRVPRPALVSATRQRATEVVPEGAYGFTIAHDALSAGLGIVYWWANENEIHSRVFMAPSEAPAELEPADGTGMACVWELEVIDFERRAWLEDVMKGEDPARYLERTLAETEL
jgi:hypothetical protein